MRGASIVVFGVTQFALGVLFGVLIMQALS